MNGSVENPILPRRGEIRVEIEASHAGVSAVESDLAAVDQRGDGPALTLPTHSGPVHSIEERVEVFDSTDGGRA